MPQFDAYAHEYGTDKQLKLLRDFFTYLDSSAHAPFTVHFDIWDPEAERTLYLAIKANGDVDVTWNTRRPHIRRWGLINLTGGIQYPAAVRALQRIPIGLLQQKFDGYVKNYS